MKSSSAPTPPVHAVFWPTPWAAASPLPIRLVQSRHNTALIRSALQRRAAQALPIVLLTLAANWTELASISIAPDITIHNSEGSSRKIQQVSWVGLTDIRTF